MMIEGQDIVCVGSANWDSMWVNAQHMMYRLAKKNRVLYVESLGLRTPSTSKSDMSKVSKRLGSLFKGTQKPYADRELYLSSPLILPFHSVKSIRDINSAMVVFKLTLAMGNLDFKDPLLWIFLPTGAGLIGHLDEKAVIYYCVDDYKQNPGVNAKVIQKLEADILKKADLAFATAPYIYEEKLALNPNTYYSPNVADTASYSDPDIAVQGIPEDLLNIPRPIIGFTGNISSYKIDMVLLQHIAIRQPDWQIVMIGPVGEGDPNTDINSIKDLPNIHFLGRKNKEELPSYVHHFDIGIIPNVISDSTRSSFPMKFYEYMAAGKAIVATQLPALASYQDKTDLCTLAPDYDAFIAAIDNYLKSVNDNALQELRQTTSQQHNWESRLDFVSEKIKKHIPTL